MTNEEFSALVSRLEQQSRDSPRWYRVRVTLLAVLGYGYVGIMLAPLIALSLAAFASAIYLKTLAVKIAIPILVVVGLVLKAMWVRLPPPEGRALDPGEVPALFEMIEQLRRKLKAPRFHRVLLTGDFNAAVVQQAILDSVDFPGQALIINVEGGTRGSRRNSAVWPARGYSRLKTCRQWWSVPDEIMPP